MALYLNVPGLRNSSPGHWQSLWEKNDPEHFQRIAQEDWESPTCGPWTAQIDQYLKPLSLKDVILVGHSVGCAAIIHWYFKYKKIVKGVLLVAPSDVESSSYPKYIRGFSPLPLHKLPFPSIVVASTNDHVVHLDRAQHFANLWGSKLVVLEEAGHIEEKNGFGAWPQGLELLQELSLT